jgi:hypothetical protein
LAGIAHVLRRLADLFAGPRGLGAFASLSGCGLDLLRQRFGRSLELGLPMRHCGGIGIRRRLRGELLLLLKEFA